MSTVHLCTLLVVGLVTLISSTDSFAQQYRKLRHALMLKPTTVHWHKLTDSMTVESTALKPGDTVMVSGVNRDSASGRGLSYAVKKANLVGEIPIASVARFVQTSEPMPEVENTAPASNTTSGSGVSGGNESTAQQCSATTKAGTRCTRTTTRASGKCWQHDK